MKPLLIALLFLSNMPVVSAGVMPGSRAPAAWVTGGIRGDHFNASVLTCINEMRSDPGKFYHKYVVPYIRQKGSRFTPQYTRSLEEAMLSSPSLPLFTSSPVLEHTADLQAGYLARFKGRRLTHDQGSTDFAERMKKAGLHCLAENLYTDDDPDPLEVVLDLLIDQNIPSFGHRKNLMNPVYTQIGIVNTTPKGGRTIVVMDFGCTKP
jgi:hypothetical protein